jgi:hypothetical protein
MTAQPLLTTPDRTGPATPDTARHDGAQVRR